MENEKRNVVKVDGKLFVKKISRCVCRLEIDGVYILECRIKERGLHEYEYTPNAESIKRYLASPKFLLSEEAKKTLNDAINERNEKIEKLVGTPVVRKDGDEQIYFYYERIDGLFDCIIDYVKEGRRVLEYVKQEDLFCMLRSIPSSKFLFYYGNTCSENEFNENPIVIAARRKSDVRLEKELRMLYRIATDEDCAFLSKIYDKRILPKLDEKYDKNYIVDFNDVDVALLSRSGYFIVHTPYFSMKGSTHALWQLNPHKKDGVDAAPEGSEAITFNEFLALFDEK